MARTIQIKRGLQANVENLTLQEGELAVALDTGNVYIGTTAGTKHLNPAVSGDFATENDVQTQIETHDEDAGSHVDIRSRVEAVNTAIGTTVSSHNNSETAHADIRGELAGKENVSNRVVQANATGADVTDGQYYSAAATEKRLSAKIEAHNSESVGVHPYILQSVTGQLNAHNASTAAHADIRQELENLAAAIRALGGDV